MCLHAIHSLYSAVVILAVVMLHENSQILTCRTAYLYYLAFLHEKQRTQIQDMLPQQYYNDKFHIFNT